MGMNVPLSITQKASEQMNDPDRIKQAKKIRNADAKERERVTKEMYDDAQ